MFFFSSRRRHTRYWRDWSSDVCSSDLRHQRQVSARRDGLAVRPEERVRLEARLLGNRAAERRVGGAGGLGPRSGGRRGGEEGRSWWGPRHLKKKHDIKQLDQPDDPDPL